MNNSYHILLKDVGRTFNINMHTFHCFGKSKEEAIGKMVVRRPDYRTEDIQKITEFEFGSDNENVYYMEERLKQTKQK